MLDLEKMSVLEIIIKCNLKGYSVKQVNRMKNLFLQTDIVGVEIEDFKNDMVVEFGH